MPTLTCVMGERRNQRRNSHHASGRSPYLVIQPGLDGQPGPQRPRRHGSASASASAKPEKTAKAGDAALAGSSTEKNHNDQLVYILGGVAVVLALGATAFALGRQRRRTT
ncbi:hypothetical protein OG379_28240 [Streptomyces sp. NBC_01166]|nr:hypothetical protein OG379_28240 [Streptomyces sp. NBC_01166]